MITSFEEAMRAYGGTTKVRFGATSEKYRHSLAHTVVADLNPRKSWIFEKFLLSICENILDLQKGSRKKTSKLVM